MVALLAIAAAGLGYLRTWPPLATVMSGSMAPTINTGDMVLVKKLDGGPRVGDIVTVNVPSSARTRFGYPPVVIHRIVAIDKEGVVTTKGDAFKKVDPFDVPTSALSTKVVATVPAVGRVFAFLGSTLGLMWLAGGAIMLIGMPLLDRYREGQRRGLDERDDMHTVLQTVTEELALLRAERGRELDEAAVHAAEREQLRAANAAVSKQLEQLPAQIERAVAAAIAAGAPAPPPPPPPVPRAPGRLIAASAWKPPTPDLMAALRPPARAAGGIFSTPPDFAALTA